MTSSLIQVLLTPLQLFKKILATKRAPYLLIGKVHFDTSFTSVSIETRSPAIHEV